MGVVCGCMRVAGNCAIAPGCLHVRSTGVAASGGCRCCVQTCARCAGCAILVAGVHECLGLVYAHCAQCKRVCDGMPSSVAGIFDRVPKNLPTALRPAAIMTASSMLNPPVLLLKRLCLPLINNRFLHLLKRNQSYGAFRKYCTPQNIGGQSTLDGLGENGVEILQKVK